MKRVFLVFALLLIAAFALSACDMSKIKNGQIEVDGTDLSSLLPCAVEVAGLEGVSGTVEVKPVAEADKDAALSLVRETYGFDEGIETYAVDISIVGEDGEEISVDHPVTVSIEMKTAELPLDRYVVFHIHDGEATRIVPRVSDGKLVFEIDSFSLFVVTPAPTHAHEWSEWTTETAATCASAGRKTRKCSVCEQEEAEEIPATGEQTPGEWKLSGDGAKEYRECTVCHAVLDEREPQGHTHVSSDWIIDSEPT
ncbi:MAG: hypothetical protein J6125_04865, partial [Clostridia bacterium]|nr:hypothetical protein [Clostridia bacterium]